MAHTRLEIQDILESVMNRYGGKVYFQPPGTEKLSYPCIVYHLDKIDTRYANNKPYTLDSCYSLVVIDRDPDSDIPRSIAALPTCRFSRYYTSDNLHHYAFTIY